MSKPGNLNMSKREELESLTLYTCIP